MENINDQTEPNEWSGGKCKFILLFSSIKNEEGK